MLFSTKFGEVRGMSFEIEHHKWVGSHLKRRKGGTSGRFETWPRVRKSFVR